MKRLHFIHFSKLSFFFLSAGLGVFFQSEALIIIALALLGLILFEHNLEIKIPSGMAIVFVGFIIFSLVFGSYWNFYERFSWWDDMLHGFYGGAFALIGFLLIQYISVRHGIKNSTFIICVFSFCFSVAFGAIWEIYEFSYDQLTGGNMQKTNQGNGVTDTMNDIILESIAALIVNIFIYFYIASGTQNWVGRVWQSFLKLNKRQGSSK